MVLELLNYKKEENLQQEHILIFSKKTLSFFNGCLDINYTSNQGSPCLIYKI